ncbi:ATP-binding protein [Sphingobacterium faecium]|uniref:ATP-binding protein n=1 Tax=Sphingobacterium faecium TaxID=34087 RepID=UPI002468BCF0|nr:ATP-binding protein [Sphingobacterium faecium]MDH5826413.1 ATP-binding protein [Sphingobacterium faecium]
MKKILNLSLALVLGVSVQAQHKLEKIWETDSIINLPESVLPDTKAGILYISIMGNSADEKDGIGGIGKLDLSGKVIDLEWINGLNSPKGLAKHGNILYAADITDVVVIDIPSSKVVRKIPIAGSVFLNDITVSDKGVVYVSDSRTKKIHQIINNKDVVYLENIDGVNGLKAIGKDLYIAGGNKQLLKANEKKELTTIADMPCGGDGIEPIGNGDFVYSCWGGYIYYVHANGKSELLLDSSAEKKNTADIGYDPITKIIYVPTFFKKSVAAYQLK